MAMTRIPRRRLERGRAVDRDRFVVQACRARRVLHVGCADHPFTEAKFETGDLLHQKLMAVAADVAGIDRNRAAVDWLGQRGVGNLHVADAEAGAELVQAIGFRPEVVVAGEILEHLSRPFDFLLAMRDLLSDGAELIVSVPNAFCIERTLMVLVGIEKTHPEHVAYYSPYTLQELLRRAGLAIVEIAPCHYPTSGHAGAGYRLQRAVTEGLQQPLRWAFPHLAPGYVLRAIPAASPPPV
ncbi:class I SAM-dependent methyltransferase [Oceanibacterium hippocampi]|uniref:Bifunctional 3-demethylubiquinone-9 3-methyltransferase/ 2-octaprenyl-6-hydroxy phenol methylase n=1 Tax=Oceanibacterium hippocampi TaxID=745714 RepID=A0A1Y5SW45_9PROT|nr:class I SAM-dependent methyltransferase [Oceanibacterium hippocampi]SLN49833.1 hypothetical protein OCH7691_02182 [Oceanibacterium hippocampi]